MYPKLKDTLFHGTVAKLDRIDVSYGRSHKDFGRGFYMAVSKSQAIGMMHKKYREAVRRSRDKNAASFVERLYEIQLDLDYMKTLDVRQFWTADMEWLEFVLLCREQGGVPHQHDVVIGPIADDDTNLCLRSYWDGLYGKKGTREAREILLRNLKPDHLGIQYYIGKQEIADRLIVRCREIEWGKG